MHELIYQSPQTHAIIQYVREHYGDELEFLWPKFSSNAIWRNPTNRKWYAAILIVSRRKLGLDSDEEVEILFKVRVKKWVKSSDKAIPMPLNL